jgi:hypothetical protein
VALSPGLASLYSFVTLGNPVNLSKLFLCLSTKSKCVIYLIGLCGALRGRCPGEMLGTSRSSPRSYRRTPGTTVQSHAGQPQGLSSILFSVNGCQSSLPIQQEGGRGSFFSYLKAHISISVLVYLGLGASLC